MARKRKRQRTSAKSSPGTGTSAIWKTVLLAWLTILTPIFISVLVHYIADTSPLSSLSSFHFAVNSIGVW